VNVELSVYRSSDAIQIREGRKSDFGIQFQFQSQSQSQFQYQYHSNRIPDIEFSAIRSPRHHCRFTSSS
jgi:hypothetical protein